MGKKVLKKVFWLLVALILIAYLVATGQVHGLLTGLFS
jgi:hypothetical protein